MNKFIQSDIHNGTTYLKCAIMNILNDLVNEEILEFDCGPYIPYTLFIDCLIENGFDVTCCIDYLFKIPNKKDRYIKWEVNNNNIVIKLI